MPKLILLITLIRLVPYALLAHLANKKGYKWLFATGLWFISLALLNTFHDINQQTRAVLSSVGAFLLMMHALNIPPKGGEK